VSPRTVVARPMSIVRLCGRAAAGAYRLDQTVVGLPSSTADAGCPGDPDCASDAVARQPARGSGRPETGVVVDGPRRSSSTSSLAVPVPPASERAVSRTKRTATVAKVTVLAAAVSAQVPVATVDQERPSALTVTAYRPMRPRRLPSWRGSATRPDTCVRWWRSRVMVCGNGGSWRVQRLCHMVRRLPSRTLRAGSAGAVPASLAVAVHPVRGSSEAIGSLAAAGTISPCDCAIASMA